ncbi:hypothetical protein HIJ39_23520, partial [Sulfobacillus sp. DSM 109850]|nr:hypothetical protein [Sulfobacillus harzensis]
ERFGLLVDAEWVHRQNRRWARRLRECISSNRNGEFQRLNSRSSASEIPDFQR